ncbi:uncharacterized protein LOC133332012 [Musca vetustissima]|uniref:uncharacterized protein LOC133332012 n=1 Tax=Musca vetustissima TaxID=27455 RepID=UPI002AB68F99|nr:uncharacterized protein LOC133332012 [Musca vetustissima]
MAGIMDDNRILWLKCTISNVLGVFEPEFVNAVIYDNMNDFKSFLEDKYTKNEDINKVVLYMWRTFYDKLVEEEITVLEEGKFVHRPLHEHTVEPELPTEPEKKDKKGKKGKKGQTAGKDAKASTPNKGLKTAKDSGREKGGGDDFDAGIDTGADSAGDDIGAESVKSSALSASDDDDEIGSRKSGKGKGRKKKRKTIQAPVPVYVEVKKIIPTFVKTPILHCHFGELSCTHFDNNIKYVYMIRKEVNGIAFYSDINECFAEMSQYFIFGTVRGELIKSMSQDVDMIFKKAIEFQFREPKLIEGKHMENYESQTPGEVGTETTEVKDTAPGLLELAKPSEFRLKALKQKRYVKHQFCCEMIEL